MSQYPYEDQWSSAPVSAPSVVMWFKVYAAAMAVVYLAVAAMGALLLIYAEDAAGSGGANSTGPFSSETEMIFLGVIYLALGLVLAVAFVLPFILGRSKGSWVYSIVLICLGLTSVCLLPATIPLLLFWIKPETKDWYIANRSV